MSKDDLTLVYATFPDIGMAETVAGKLVERELAACANILPNMISIYRWKGRVEQDSEVSMIVKTRARLVAQVTEAIVEAHPYDTPAVVGIPVTGGFEPFLAWIREETKGV